MVLDLDVLGLLMKLGVLCHGYCTFVIAKDFCGLNQFVSKFSE